MTVVAQNRIAHARSRASLTHSQFSVKLKF